MHVCPDKSTSGRVACRSRCTLCAASFQHASKLKQALLSQARYVPTGVGGATQRFPSPQAVPSSLQVSASSSVRQQASPSRPHSADPYPLSLETAPGQSAGLWFEQACLSTNGSVGHCTTHTGKGILRTSAHGRAFVANCVGFVARIFTRSRAARLIEKATVCTRFCLTATLFTSASTTARSCALSASLQRGNAPSGASWQVMDSQTRFSAVQTFSPSESWQHGSPEAPHAATPPELRQ